MEGLYIRAYNRIIASKSLNAIKLKYYKILFKKYKFPEWHVSTICDRQYALDIVIWLNCFLKNTKSVVCEIGCGLGEIIGNISVRPKNKYGYDIDESTVAAARLANPGAIYRVGSFENIHGMNIEVLITVNFIHEIHPDVLRAYYGYLLKNNHIKYIVIDCVDARGDYKYKHDGNYLFGLNNGIKAHLVKRFSERYPAASGSKRIIEVWRVS